jgi:hypothetical protein
LVTKYTKTYLPQISSIKYAVDISDIDPDHMLVYSREFTGPDPPPMNEKLEKFKSSLPNVIPAQHYVQLR